MKKPPRRNKGFIMALFAMVFTITLAHAQPVGPQGKQQRPPPIPNEKQIQKMVTKLSKELSLSEKQEKQVSDMYVAHFDEVGEMQAKNKNSQPDREVMEQMRGDFETDIKSNFTKDQQKQFDEFVKKQQSQQNRRK